MRFQCAVSGHPDPFVTWDKDGEIVTPSPRITIMERDDLKILEISDVTPNDSGVYRVRLENDLGKIEASAKLEVIKHRTFSMRGLRARSSSPRPTPTYRRTYDSIGSRYYGRDARLFSDIRSIPTPYLKYYTNEIATQNMVKRAELPAEITTDSPMLTTPSRVEFLAPVATQESSYSNTSAKEAEFHAPVAPPDFPHSNGNTSPLTADETTSTEAEFQPPTITEDLPPTKSVYEGESLILEAKVKGTEPLDVVWMKDGCVVTDGDGVEQYCKDGVVGLIVNESFLYDAGDYRCEIYGPYGEAMSRCTVQVKGRYQLNE